MKKIKFIFTFIIIFLPNIIKAYGIDNYYIDATIQNNGDILVQEYFNLTGEYNGFERIIQFANEDLYEFDPNNTSFGGSLIHNGTNLEIKEVRAISNDISIDFNNIKGDIFELTSSATKGDYGVYTVDSNLNGKSVLIYNPSSYNNAFYIKYIIKNIAIKHNDVAEIGWNVIGNKLSESVANLKVTLHIPNNQNIKAWAHGPLNGNVKIIDSETVEFTITGLSSYRAIDIRATFDLNVINESTKTTNTDALEKIILYETDKAEQANYERQNKQKIIINDATRKLNSFEVNITRYNYQYALATINKIEDNNIKTELMNKLITLKNELDILEEQEAREELEFALRYPTYYNYKSLQEKIEILDNIEVKTELLIGLKKVEKLIKIEEKKLEKTNYIKGSIYIIILIILGFYSYKKYVKSPKVNFNQKYYREIENEIPTTISYLMNKKINKNALSASMLDLVRRKIITAEKISRNNYKLKLNEEKMEIPSVYRRLISLIFGNKSIIETKNIKKHTKQNYDSYIRNWKKYNKESLEKAKEKLYFESDEKEIYIKNSKINDKSFLIPIFIIIFVLIPSLGIMILLGYMFYIVISKGIKFILDIIKGKLKNKKVLITLSYIIIALISIYKFISILIIQKFYHNSMWLYLMILIISITLIIILYKNKKRTEYGALEYKKWKAIKNFLKDFGTFQDKEIPEIELWEKYLVFATLFGCSKKIIKVMKLELVDNPEIPSDIYYDMRLTRCLTRSITSSYASAQNVYAANNSSGGSYSSGGGGGGGFSSGGGSFGGGGGGGRF